MGRDLPGRRGLMGRDLPGRLRGLLGADPLLVGGVAVVGGHASADAREQVALRRSDLGRKSAAGGQAGWQVYRHQEAIAAEI